MIKAYLFSDITRQIDHTYYSLHGSTMGPSKFFYNLKDYKISMLSLLDPFIYEVEIYPELSQLWVVLMIILKLENIKL